MIRPSMAALAIMLASPLAAKDIKAGNIVITDPVLRVTTAQARTGAGFMTIGNSGKQADRLLSAASDIAAITQLHATIREGNVMQMREQAQGVIIPAASRVAFAAGGLHVMFIGLKAPLAPGQMVKLRLNFEKAGAVDVALAVQTASTSQAH
jgi:periplasmic copper chaperone A